MPNPDDIDRREATVTHVESRPPIEGVDGGADAHPTPASAPSGAHTERVTIDYAAERHASLVRASRLISFIFGVIVALIGIRVALKFMAANPASPFAQFIYGLTGMFVAPFIGLTASPAIDGSVLELFSLVAAVIYALVGWALVKLLWVVFFRPSTRSVSTRTYHHT